MKLFSRNSVPHTARTTPAAQLKLRVKSVRGDRVLTGAHGVPYGLRTQSRIRPQPTTSLFSGMLRAFGGSKTAGSPAVAAKALAFADNAPTWEALAELVRAKQEAHDVMEPDLEQGPTSPLSLKRTFGKSGPIRIKLYRDHAAWCPYCQKVWLQLEEKQLPYTIEKINMRCYGDKPRDFIAKVPSGLLPVLELDGRVVTESSVIMQLLEEQFPERPLMPPQGTPQRQQADMLMRLERKFFSDWLQWLTSEWNQAAAAANFQRTMDLINSQLEASEGPFFLGADISLVDITFTPMLERANASLAYYKGFHLRGRGLYPAVDAWFTALEARPAYLGTRSDFYTHAHDLPPQLGGCGLVAEGVPVKAAIDGTDGAAWKLPLPPLSATSMPEPYAPGDNPELDTLYAASRMVKNHEAIVKFALRGPGQPGPRPVSAPLADPTAVAALQHLDAADAAFRHVAHALLVGVEAKQVGGEALQASESASGGLPGGPVVQAAQYFRDRVGVPRDMPYPAARQLRAHLNWLIDSLQPTA